jgi:perosamine synthetase
MASYGVNLRCKILDEEIEGRGMVRLGEWGSGIGGLAGVGGWGGVYARHRLDLSSGDISFGLPACGRMWEREWLEAEVSSLCSLGDEGLVCLSVRSGWDLWLEAQGLRARDEILVSAVTHPDMVGIIRAHGLRAIPVDIDPETLAPQPWMLKAALTPRTRVVLAAHLFGGRMDLRPVVEFAREHGLLLVEDCAQAFQGPDRVGDSAADVTMYSFGSLKTSTALGGAVLRVRDREVLDRMHDIQASYPVQRRATYLRKLLTFLGLIAVSHPCPYGLFARACMRLGYDLDTVVNGVVRGFPLRESEATFLQRLRQRPSAPLLAMLLRKLETFDGERLARRASTGERCAGRLREGLHPGRRSLARTHWLFPVVVEDPEALILALRARGLDASRATSSIAVVEVTAGGTSPTEASQMMSGVVFLPVYPELPKHAFDVMAGLVNGCAAPGAAERVAL